MAVRALAALALVLYLVLGSAGRAAAGLLPESDAEVAIEAATPPFGADSPDDDAPAVPESTAVPEPQTDPVDSVPVPDASDESPAEPSPYASVEPTPVASVDAAQAGTTEEPPPATEPDGVAESADEPALAEPVVDEAGAPADAVQDEGATVPEPLTVEPQQSPTPSPLPAVVSAPIAASADEAVTAGTPVVSSLLEMADTTSATTPTAAAAAPSAFARAKAAGLAIASSRPLPMPAARLPMLAAIQSMPTPSRPPAPSIIPVFDTAAGHGPTDNLWDLATASAIPSAGVVLAPRLPNPVAIAVEFGRAGNGWAGALVFNVWLRRELRERRMSQRQLGQLAGVHHSTISRLLNDGRAPSLETATKLAHALRLNWTDERIAAYFDLLSERTLEPIQRVEGALRGDPDLADDDVRALMRAYLARRLRQRAEHGP